MWSQLWPFIFTLYLTTSSSIYFVGLYVLFSVFATVMFVCFYIVCVLFIGCCVMSFFFSRCFLHLFCFNFVSTDNTTVTTPACFLNVAFISSILYTIFTILHYFLAYSFQKCMCFDTIFVYCGPPVTVCVDGYSFLYYSPTLIASFYWFQYGSGRFRFMFLSTLANDAVLAISSNVKRYPRSKLHCHPIQYSKSKQSKTKHIVLFRLCCKVAPSASCCGRFTWAVAILWG